MNNNTANQKRPLNKGSGRSLMLKSMSAVLSPLFTALFYVSIFAAAVMVIICIIVIFVNVSTDEMLLPPFMRLTESAEGISEYIISLGNGIKIVTPAEKVTLSMIKTAIYTSIAVAAAVCIVLAPIFRFLSGLLKNVSCDLLFEKKNADYINYTGITILVGNTAVLFASRFFNYYLVKLFVSDGTNVAFSAGLDIMGVVIGLFVLLLGNIYGCAIRMHNLGAPASASETLPIKK